MLDTDEIIPPMCRSICATFKQAEGFDKEIIVQMYRLTKWGLYSDWMKKKIISSCTLPLNKL